MAEISKEEYLKALDVVEKYHSQIGLKPKSKEKGDKMDIYKRFMKELDPDQGIGEVIIERVIGTQRLVVTLNHPEQTLAYQNYIRMLAGDDPVHDRPFIEAYFGSDVPKKIVHPYRLS